MASADAISATPSLPGTRRCRRWGLLGAHPEVAPAGRKQNGTLNIVAQGEFGKEALAKGGHGRGSPVPAAGTSQRSRTWMSQGRGAFTAARKWLWRGLQRSVTVA